MPRAARIHPVAIVTGGAKGIGRAVVDHLLEQSWRVCVVDVEGSGARRAFPARRRGVTLVEGDVGQEDTAKRAVAEALGLLGERAARPAIERLLADESVDMRVSACRALGRLAAIESGTALLHALRDDAWAVRAQAAKALGLARVMIAVPALGECLTDRSWWVRRHSAYALARLGYDGKQMLHSIAADSPDPYARDMALEVIEGGSQAA